MYMLNKHVRRNIAVLGFFFFSLLYSSAWNTIRQDECKRKNLELRKIMVIKRVYSPAESFE